MKKEEHSFAHEDGGNGGGKEHMIRHHVIRDCNLSREEPVHPLQIACTKAQQR